MKYVLFDNYEVLKAEPNKVGAIYIASDVFKRVSATQAKVTLPITLASYEEQLKLANDIAEYMNLCEEAKASVVKDKTVAAAVLQRMHRDS